MNHSRKDTAFGTLSRRLSRVATWVPPQCVVADIGSDHAQLLIALVQNGMIPRGIAGEVNDGPWRHALHRVKKAGLEEKIQVRKGDGLDVLAEGEAQVIVIAGMGGSLIASILDRGLNKLNGTERLILQPNNHAARVRQWLYHHGWQLDREDLVKEAGILYEVLSALPGNPDSPYRGSPLSLASAFEMGPLLWNARHPLLVEKLEAELSELKRIQSQLTSGGTENARNRMEQITEKQNEWRRWYQWLQQDGN
jgi:tRNA (adenine22-N1)-methyltransferase